jgi:hypothetical protein
MPLVGEGRRSRRVRSAIRRERSEPLDPGSRAAVLRRREPTCPSSASDDEVGGLQSAIRASGASNQTPHYADEHAPAR